MNKVQRLYISESIVGTLCLTQSIIGVTLVDHIKSLAIVKILRNVTKFCIVSYFFMFVARIILYWDVHSAIKEIDPGHEDKGIGSFMAEYIDDTTGSIIVTSVLLALLSIFYLSNFYIIKLMTKMLDFIESQQEEHLIS